MVGFSVRKLSRWKSSELSFPIPVPKSKAGRIAPPRTPHLKTTGYFTNLFHKDDQQRENRQRFDKRQTQH